MKYNLSIEKILRFEKLINYHFQNQNLLLEALSHPSLKQYGAIFTKNYERLEILGDSILGFVVTEMLFNKDKNSPESDIAKKKAYLVSKNIICLVANKINLADFIIMTEGEEKTGGRINSNNVENTMEAVIAAIYLDSDFNRIKEIVNNLWFDFLNDFDLKKMDPKTSLQEWSQCNKHGMPIYEVVKQEGPSHLPIFTILVTVGSYFAQASDNSIKNAEKLAAKKLLDKIDHFQ